MTDNLPALRATCPVALYDADVDHILSWALSGAHRPHHNGPLQLLNYPQGATREVLGARLNTLATSLRQKDNAAVARAVTDMLTCYPSLMKEGDANHKRQVVAKYVTELQGVAAWAAIQACEAIRHGQAPNISRTYPPSTIEVRAFALTFTESIRAELGKIGEVLQGKEGRAPVPADVQKIICGKLKVLADDLGERDKARIGSDNEGRQKVLTEYAEKGLRFIRRQYAGAAAQCAPGIPISRELAARISAPRERGGWQQSGE